MSQVNLEYYRAFYQVAINQSVTKAAEVLCLSQPSVTHSVKMLESGLGCRLFHRNSRGMSLTQEGKILFSHVSDAFHALEKGEQELSDLSFTGHLSIGATETGLHHYLLPKIAAFSADHPNVDFSITGENTPELLKALLAGNIDLAVAVSPVSLPKGLSEIAVQEFSDIVIAGKKHAELKEREIDPVVLMDYPIAAVEHLSSARDHLEMYFKTLGIPFKPVYTVKTSSMVLPFVTHNLALGILPEFFAEETIRTKEVFQVKLTRAIPPRQMIVIYRKDQKDISDLCRLFLRFLTT